MDGPQLRVLVGGRMGRWRSSAVVISAAVDTRVQGLEQTCVCVSLGGRPTSGVVESCGSSISFLRKEAF